MKPEIEIYDTTLRDGSQGEGINFSVADKLRIAERIDAFGIHYIEGGWPGSNPKDIEFFAQARRKKFKRARLAAFGATRRKGVAVENDEQVRQLLEAGTPVVTVVGKTSLLHVKKVLRTTPEENLAMIADTIRYLKDHRKMVIFDAEHSFDGFSDEPDYSLATWQAAEKAGADFVVLCDTNGGRLPNEIRAGLLGRLPGGERVVRPVAEAVKAMFGVVDDEFAVGFEIADRVADHCQILLRRRAQHFFHVQQPGLPDDGHH